LLVPAETVYVPKELDIRKWINLDDCSEINPNALQ
jgi:hypothetical protein